MRILKALAPWSPWIAFLVIAQGSLFRLGVGLAAGLLTAVVLAAFKLYRGILMWLALVFFAGSFVTVFGLHNTWVSRHLGLIANAMLAAGAWGSLLTGRPFTLVYARENTDPAIWNHPLFLRVNRMITLTWASALTLNAVVAGAQGAHLIPPWCGGALTLANLAGAVAFSSWYPKRVRQVVPPNNVA